jgi:hypothetical protein
VEATWNFEIFRSHVRRVALPNRIMAVELSYADWQFVHPEGMRDNNRQNLSREPTHSPHFVRNFGCRNEQTNLITDLKIKLPTFANA